jgi:hypothetical protein
LPDAGQPSADTVPPATGTIAPIADSQPDTARPAAPSLGGLARQLGDLVIGLVSIGPAGSRRVIGWAADRALAPNSVTAIALLFALCAAAWLSGGTLSDYWHGLAALAAWGLTRTCARRLNAVVAARGQSAVRRPVKRPARTAGTRPGRPGSAGTDWLILPGFDWPGADRPRPAAAIPVTKPRAGERSFGWLSEVSTVAAECAVYGGITAGGEAAGWTGTWPLAIVTVVVVSVAEVAGTCARAKSGSASRAPGSQAQALPRAWTTLGLLFPPPVAVRVLTAALVAARYGPRIALFTVLVIEAVALARALASLAEPSAAALEQPASSTLTATSRGQDVLLACRDDGPLARLAGRLVQGNLGPLPPVLLALVAIVLLAVLGLRHLPGIVALTPFVVLLLAAPGASHPHDGRFDWLVPVLICLAQYSYLVALGLAKSVPGPAIFSTISMIAVWYASLVASPRARNQARGKVLSSRQERITRIIRRRADGLGWEARVGVASVTSIFGVTAFGYLGLAAYLATLMARKAAIGYLLPPDERPKRKVRPR